MADSLVVTKAQAAELAGCSIASIDRMMNRGELDWTRIGDGPRGGVRISRDSLLKRLGLISGNEQRRRTKKAEAEAAQAAATWGE